MNDPSSASTYCPLCGKYLGDETYHFCSGFSPSYPQRVLPLLSGNAHVVRGKDISLGTVRSLAMLGAAVVLLYEREITADMDGDVCLPAAIPDWIREAIYRLTEEKT